MFLQPLIVALKSIPIVKFEKETIDNDNFFTFFTTLGLIWPKFFPKTTPALTFFACFPMKYIRGFSRDVKPFYKLDIKNFTLPSYESPSREDFKMGSFIFRS